MFKRTNSVVWWNRVVILISKRLLLLYDVGDGAFVAVAFPPWVFFKSYRAWKWIGGSGVVQCRRRRQLNPTEVWDIYAVFAGSSLIFPSFAPRLVLIYWTARQSPDSALKCCLHPCLAVSVYITRQLDLTLVTTSRLPLSATYWSTGKLRQVKTNYPNPKWEKKVWHRLHIRFVLFSFSTNPKIDRKVVKVTDGHGHGHEQRKRAVLSF